MTELERQQAKVKAVREAMGRSPIKPVVEREQVATRVAEAVREAQRVASANAQKAVEDLQKDEKTKEERVAELMRELNSLQPRGVGLGHQIAQAVARAHKLTMKDLTGGRRSRNIAWARQEAMWHIKEHTKLSLPQIGRMFNRDHTTVLHALRVHKERMEKGIV